MQEKRLELSWYCYHTDLNRARLPIPPFLRTNHILYDSLEKVNRNFLSFLKKLIFQSKCNPSYTLALRLL